MRLSMTAMGNLRPFELFSVALLKSLKYSFFIVKSTKSPYFGPRHDRLAWIWPSSRFGLPMADLWRLTRWIKKFLPGIAYRYFWESSKISKDEERRPGFFDDTWTVMSHVQQSHIELKLKVLQFRGNEKLKIFIKN